MVAIRREGFPYIVGLALAATVLSIVSLLTESTLVDLVTILSWILVVLVINFFRDPERKAPSDAQSIIAPADGKVIDVRMVKEESYLLAEVLRVSIFMSVFDVHVNRAPLRGQIDFLDYHKGTFLAAFREDASAGNEQLSIGIRTVRPGGNGESASRIMIKLIAGYLARRILFWKHLQEEVQKGERIGMIKFGSRVEVYLPPAWEIKVEKGQRVRAGETVIGRLKTP